MNSYLPLAVGYSLSRTDSEDEPLDNRAVRCWLLIHQSRSSHAARTYGIEIQRWRLFLTARKGMQNDLLFQACEDDLAEYRKLLFGAQNALSPFVLEKKLLSLCGFHSQPFIRKRSATTVNQAISVLNSFYGFLEGRNWGKAPLCGRDVWHDNSHKEIKRASNLLTSRKALRAMIETALQGAQIGPLQPRFQRALWIVQLALFLKFHRSEIANLKMGDFVKNAQGEWVVTLSRRSGSKRTVVLKSSIVDALFTYRKSLGLSAQPALGEKTAAILGLNFHEENYKPKIVSLAHEISWLAQQTVEFLRKRGNLEEDIREFLENCSSVWFQHNGVNRKIFSIWND